MMRNTLASQSPARLTSIAIALCTITTMAAVLIVVGPNRAGASSSESPVLEEERSTLDADRVQRAQLAQRLDATRNAAEPRDRITLRPASESNQTLSLLHKMAADSGLEINEVVVTAPVVHPTHSEIEIHIEARGSFANTLEFFRHLSEDTSDIVVRTFGLSGNVRGDSSSVMLSLDLAWYARSAQPD